MTGCIFCDIVAKTQPARIVRETETAVAFDDIRPSAPVHVLVVPKKHIPSVDALEEDDRPLVADLIYLARTIAQERGLKGYRLSFNVGREGGQLVDHVHLHLMGGW